MATTCEEPVQDTCNFYAECLEARHPCGENGYAIEFGDRMCRYFLENEYKFTSSGQEWSKKVRTCLQKELVPIVKSDVPVECDDIQDFAFDSHVTCYVSSGICDLGWFSDGLTLLWLLNTELLSLDTLKQMKGVLASCWREWTSKLEPGSPSLILPGNFVNLRLKNKLSDVAEYARNELQISAETFVREQLILPQLQSVPNLNPGRILVWSLDEEITNPTNIHILVLDEPSDEAVLNASIVSSDKMGKLLVDGLSSSHIVPVSGGTFSFVFESGNVCSASDVDPFCSSINSCDTNPCSENGLCVVTETGYMCECNEGFEGLTCSENSFPTASILNLSFVGVALITLFSLFVFVSQRRRRLSLEQNASSSKQDTATLSHYIA